MSKHCLLQILVAKIAFVPLTSALGDTLLQLWPEQNLLDEAPKHWYQYIKALLHHTLDTQTVMPIDQDLSALLFNLNCSTSFALIEVLHSDRNNKPNSINYKRTQNHYTFKNNMTVIQAIGEILHGSYLYKSCFEKSMENLFFQAFFVHTWLFDLDKTLVINLTIMEMDLVNDICVLNYLLVTLPTSFLGEAKYCGKQPPFSLYPPEHFVFVQYKLDTTSQTHHYVKIHYSVSDPGLLKSIDPSLFNDKSDILLLHVHQMGGFSTYTIKSFLVQVHKLYMLILQPVDCSNRSILVFDGPGPFSPRITAHNKTHQMSSFQSFVQTLTSLQQVDSCLLNYFPIQSSSVHTISVTKRALFLYSQEICTLSPCIMLLKTHISFQLNVTLAHMNYFVNGSLHCFYGGFSVLELHPQIQEELTCKPSAKHNVHQNLYSQRSQIFCILYWYKAYSFVDVDLHISMVKCRAVKIDICAQTMCFYMDLLNNPKHCETYFNSLYLQFGINITHKNTQLMAGIHRTMKMVNVDMQNQSCVVVQARNEGLLHLFGRASLSTCTIFFNFAFFCKSYVMYQITGNISRQTFHMHTSGSADEICFTTVLGSNGSLSLLCQKFQRFLSGSFKAPFFSMKVLKQHTGKRNDMFYLMLLQDQSSAVEFVVKKCVYVSSPSECGVSIVNHPLRCVFPENEMLKQFSSETAYQSPFNYPLTTSPFKKEIFTLSFSMNLERVDSVQALALMLVNNDRYARLEFTFTRYQHRRLLRRFDQNEDSNMEISFPPPATQQSVLVIWIHDNSSDLHTAKKLSSQTQSPINGSEIMWFDVETDTMEQYVLHVLTAVTSWIDAVVLCRNVKGHLPTATSDKSLRELLSLLEEIYPTCIIDALFIGLLFSWKVSS